MESRLNPEAAEFVPSSPPLLNNRNNALQDYPISGSPLKQTPAMDDILIPSQSEFEKEVCLRPKEIDEDFPSNDEQQKQQPAAAAACDNNLDLDVSEISSTKVEVGDDSLARNVSTTQWQADLSQWSTTTRNDAGSDSEEYDIVNRDSDPMTMSFTPGDLEAAFEKGVDLNAVHELDDSSDDNTPPGSPGGQRANENVRAYTPLSDCKDPIDLLLSSTPHPADSQSIRTTSESDDRAQAPTYSAFMTCNEAISTEQQLGVAPLAESTISRPDQSTNPFQVDNNESSERDYTESSAPAESTQEVREENKTLIEQLMEHEQLQENVDETQSESRVVFSELVPLSSDILVPEIPESVRPPLSEDKKADDIKKPWKLRIIKAPYLQLGEYEPPRDPSIRKHPYGEERYVMFLNDDEDVRGRTTLDFSKSDYSPKVDCDTHKDDTHKDDTHNKDRDTHSSKKQCCNDHPDKFEKDDDDDVAPNNIISSEESLKCLEFKEKPNQPKSQTPGSTRRVLSNFMQAEAHLKGLKLFGVRRKTIQTSEDTPVSKEEKTKPPAKDQKATTTLTKRSTKTATTSTTKSATKATSPTKAVSSITSSRTTAASSPAQSATAKKLAAPRPKPEVFTRTLAAISDRTSGKVTGTKTTSSANRSATTTVTATKTSVSPRVSTVKSKTSATVTASSRLSASATSAEKRPTTNKVAGASARATSARSTTTAGITTNAPLVNTSLSTIAKTSTATSKSPRATSAGTIAKTSPLTTSARLSTTTSRPRTAPSTVSVPKPRESSAKTTTPAKSPLIDKQSKDTVNKQISRSSATGSSGSSRIGSGRIFASGKSRSGGKSPGGNKAPETAISPSTKKTSPPAKPGEQKSDDNTLSTKKSTLLLSLENLSNGSPEDQTVENANRIITATSDKPEDDVPQKDASPLDIPTDNQLIFTD